MITVVNVWETRSSSVDRLYICKFSQTLFFVAVVVVFACVGLNPWQNFNLSKFPTSWGQSRQKQNASKEQRLSITATPAVRLKIQQSFKPQASIRLRFVCVGKNSEFTIHQKLRRTDSRKKEAFRCLIYFSRF